ncbi:cortexin-3 isoform X1 [Microcaecilia unicolor]|uniref:Cortexin-3 isoform X1 n=1 Tax=Microcaecilia unicolor TaxID=1415580 RepID=A0A6P7XFL9_9AMPH|nr:cortexin-3 isoform X1 [Microcaecilia unicolor]
MDQVSSHLNRGIKVQPNNDCNKQMMRKRKFCLYSFQFSWMMDEIGHSADSSYFLILLHRRHILVGGISQDRMTDFPPLPSLESHHTQTQGVFIYAIAGVSWEDSIKGKAKAGNGIIQVIF